MYAYFQAHGQFYLVQEYIEGDTLTTILQKQRFFNESGIHEILVSLLQVLDYVHSTKQPLLHLWVVSWSNGNLFAKWETAARIRDRLPYW